MKRLAPMLDVVLKRLERRLRDVIRRDGLRIATAIAVVLPLLLSAALAYAARPGGGNSYSGGSSRSSGGGGGGGGSYSGGGSGDGAAVGALIALCFENPALGIPVVLLVLIVVGVRWYWQNQSSGKEWTTSSPASTYTPPHFHGNLPPQRALPPASPRRELEGLRRTDPAFSVIVFEDFLYFLYAEMHRARGAAKAEMLAAYLGDPARAALHNDGRLAEVTGIIIGAMSYEDVTIDPGGSARLAVIIESNYVERYRPQGEQRFYVKERIVLTRAAGVQSRSPDKARILTCPSCGGPLSAARDRICTYCKTLVESGTKDWAIAQIQVLEREARGPLLTSSVEEQGTTARTIVAPNVQALFAQLQAKDPGLSWQRIEQRVGVVFQEFHAGWVQRDPSRVRPFVSDNLFQSQLYWIELYKAARCINRTDGSRITRLELASATTDAYFDAITVRLHAQGLDFTIGEDGRLLSGSQSKPRAYSEYWTLIRGAQKKAPGAPGLGDRQCPNCGAPLTINMAGNCEYCKVKVTTGEYDWVLSRIEQDESYAG